MSHHYLRFDDVHYRFPNGYEALCGVSFCITHGEKVALVGANGAGKSTLLLHTNGLLIPSQGEVVMGGIKLTRRTLPLVRQSVGLVFQDSDNQLFMPTVEEDVAFGPSNMRLEPEEIRRRVTEALDAVGALHLLDSLRRADGSRLVEGDQHVDLRMLPQQLLRRQTGFQSIGGNIDGVNALDPAVPKQHLPEALLPLPAVLGLGVGVDNAHNDFFLRRFQRGLPAHAPGRHIVRPDPDGHAV